MTTFEPNLVSFIVAPVATAALTLLITRASKGHDARAAAEAALIGIGPQIIQDQNKRIEYLNNEIDKLWRELNVTIERERQCLVRLAILESKVQ